MDQFSKIFKALWIISVGILREFWWVLLPIFLFIIFIDLWKAYRNGLNKKESSSVCLQLLFSEEAAAKPLQFMELFFNNIKNIKIPENQGISFEVIGIENQLKYFIRVPEKIKDLITITFHAQYPDVTLLVVDDVFSRVPPNIPNNEYTFWGKEYKYKKANPLPVLTYDNFYNNKDKGKKNIGEANSYDPLSVIIELFNSMKPNDIVALQLIISNLNDEEKKSWEIESKTVYNPLIGKEPPKKPESLTHILIQSCANAIYNLVTFGQYLGIEDGKDAKKDDKPKTQNESEKESAKLVETKISNANYTTSIRLSYISPKKDYTDFIPSTFEMFIKQFNTSSANSFEEIKDDSRWAKFRSKIFPNTNTYLAHSMFDRTINRQKAEKGVIMSAKELTSLFHFPFQNVYISSVVMEKNKKGAPPPTLPFIEMDKETDI